MPVGKPWLPSNPQSQYSCLIEVFSMIRFRRLRCSFCRKNEAQCAKLVAGPRVYICDECVAVARRMMEGDSHDDRESPKVQASVWRKVLARLRQFYSVNARMLPSLICGGHI